MVNEYRDEFVGYGCFSNTTKRFGAIESISWVMADADGFSRFLGIKPSLFPFDMDSIDDPKRFIIQMAGKSKKNEILRFGT